jgi:hypothetical protein
MFRQLVAALAPIELILATVGSAASSRISRASWPKSRLALIEALADIFVPSIATTPTDASPARAHKPSTPENTSPSARSCRQRNSAIVE